MSRVLFSDPNPASSSRPHASEPKQFTSTNVKDDVFGGSFDILPPRSTEPTTCRLLSANWVKKVKELEDKQKGRKRKFVMTESDIEEEEEQDVDPLIKLGQVAANLTAADDQLFFLLLMLIWNENMVHSMLNQGDFLLFVGSGGEMRTTLQRDGWTMKHVRSFSDDQLKDEFDKIRHALANLQSQHLRRSLKRQGADLDQPDSKNTSPATLPHSPKASSHPDVTPDTSKQPSVAPIPPSGFLATPTVTKTSGPRTRNQSSTAGIKTYSTRRKSLRSRKMSSSEVDLIAADSQPPSVEVPSQKASQEDVEVHILPYDFYSTIQTASSTKKVGTRRKQFGRKGVHPSCSTIPIKDEDPDAEHKMCIKYASDTDSDSDDDTPVNLHGVVDWELLPTGLGWVNDKQKLQEVYLFCGEILSLDRFHSEVNDGSDKRYPLSVNLIELECYETQLEINIEIQWEMNLPLHSVDCLFSRNSKAS
ncbi:hypothetical protein Tco_0626361 [Tanacetum coccineum]|uniref:Uncharacterized protein n=1 Tax=Tanacetum coccineum TaxID=301880 RepID=A0ABQ4WJD0_9ASTR